MLLMSLAAFAAPLDTSAYETFLETADLELVAEGRVSLVVPKEERVEFGEVVVTDGVAWRLLDQHTYPTKLDTTPMPNPTYVAQSDRSTTEYHRVDAYGRVWEMLGVESSEIVDAYIEAYDKLGTDAGGESTFPRKPEGVIPVGTEYEPELQMWSNTGTCQSQGQNKTWEGQSRFLINNDHDRQERAAVTLVINGGRCSGTLIENSHVLTAAHCVTLLNNGTTVPPKLITARVDNINQTFGAGQNGVWVTDIFTTSAYSGGPTGGQTDHGDDWAVLKFSGPIAAQTSDRLLLSQASSTTLGALAFTRQFSNPGCRVGSAPNVFMTRNTEVQPISSVTTKMVTHKIDNVAGQSGAPFYYCPSSGMLCFDNDTGFVYAVHAGYYAGNVRGPRVRHFRTPALTFMSISPQ